MFRYNFRELPHDGARFEHVASHVIGKRLTYDEVTGKDGKTAINGSEQESVNTCVFAGFL